MSDDRPSTQVRTVRFVGSCILAGFGFVLAVLARDASWVAWPSAAAAGLLYARATDASPEEAPVVALIGGVLLSTLAPDTAWLALGLAGTAAWAFVFNQTPSRAPFEEAAAAFRALLQSGSARVLVRGLASALPIAGAPWRVDRMRAWTGLVGGVASPKRRSADEATARLAAIAPGAVVTLVVGIGIAAAFEDRSLEVLWLVPAAFAVIAALAPFMFTDAVLASHEFADRPLAISAAIASNRPLTALLLAAHTAALPIATLMFALHALGRRPPHVLPADVVLGLVVVALWITIPLREALTVRIAGCHTGLRGMDLWDLLPLGVAIVATVIWVDDVALAAARIAPPSQIPLLVAFGLGLFSVALRRLA